MQLLAVSAMELPSSGDPQVLKDALISVYRAMPEADPAHYVRGQYEGYTSIELLDNPPPVNGYAKGSWGPPAADQLLGEHGPWREPWLGS